MGDMGCVISLSSGVESERSLLSWLSFWLQSIYSEEKKKGVFTHNALSAEQINSKKAKWDITISTLDMFSCE